MFRTRLTIVFCGLLALLLAVSGGLYWSTKEASYQLERSAFAHDELEDYLRLSQETYRYFKQLADAMLTSDRDNLVRAEESRLRMRALLDRLGEQINSEIGFVRDEEEREEEVEEIERLQEIREEIRIAQEEFAEVRELYADGRPEEAWTLLSHVLNTRIDGRFSTLIDEAIADEAGESERAKNDARETFARFDAFAEVVAAGSVVLVLGALVLLVQRLRRPIDQLLDSTHRLAAGRLDHRIDTAGDDEFAQLAASFNRMAGDLERREIELREARDTLEQKVIQRTEELRQANAELRRTDVNRSRFFADISHELRTPLTVIRGEAEVALRGREKSSDEYRTALERVVDQAAQLARLVDDLLFIARSGSGTARLNLELVDLPELIAAVRRDAKRLTAADDIEISAPRIDLDVLVQGDRGRLTQLFFILVDNAIRYSAPGSQVAIEIERLGPSVVVRVRDRGIGIPEDELDNVFQRFYRAENARRSVPDGSGLGLPLAKSIVEAHDGAIAIDSRVGHGTTVSVTLPSGRSRLKATA